MLENYPININFAIIFSLVPRLAATLRIQRSFWIL